MRVRNALIAALLLWSPLAAMAQEGEENDDFYRDPDASEGASTGEEDGAAASVETEVDTADPLPFRGSMIIYENILSGGTANDLSPDTSFYYAMSYSFRPRYYFSEWFSLRLRLDLEHELTDGGTTRLREPLLSDTLLYFYFSDVLDSVTDVFNLNAYLRLQFPSSKRSQSRTLVMGGTLGASASYTAPVLEGLQLGYGISMTRYFNEHPTAVQESPTTACTPGSAINCDSQLSFGLRNPAWLMVNSLTLNFSPIENLSLGISVAFYDYFLYDSTNIGTDELPVDVTCTDPAGCDIEASADDTNRRSSIWYVVEVGYQVMPWMGLAIGASTFNPQLTPDSEYRAPFFNRYTQFYFDVNLSIDGIVNAIRGREGSSSVTGRQVDEV